MARDCWNNTYRPWGKTSTSLIEWPITPPSIVLRLQDSFFPHMVNMTRDCRNKTHLSIGSSINHGTGTVPVTVPSGYLSLWTAFFDRPNRRLRHPRCVSEWLGTILPASHHFETAFPFPPPLDLTRNCWSKANQPWHKTSTVIRENDQYHTPGSSWLEARLCHLPPTNAPKNCWNNSTRALK